MAARPEDLLPVGLFHVVFTLSAEIVQFELVSLIRTGLRLGLDIILLASCRPLRSLCVDECVVWGSFVEGRVWSLGVVEAVSVFDHTFGLEDRTKNEPVAELTILAKQISKKTTWLSVLDMNALRSPFPSVLRFAESS